jgi:hypothetical protein
MHQDDARVFFNFARHRAITVSGGIRSKVHVGEKMATFRWLNGSPFRGRGEAPEAEKARPDRPAPNAPR